MTYGRDAFWPSLPLRWRHRISYRDKLSSSKVLVFTRCHCAYAVTRGPALENLSFVYVNENMYMVFPGSVSEENNRFALGGFTHSNVHYPIVMCAWMFSLEIQR